VGWHVETKVCLPGIKVCSNEDFSAFMRSFNKLTAVKLLIWKILLPRNRSASRAGSLLKWQAEVAHQ
jgi:hypothetical protein